MGDAMMIDGGLDSMRILFVENHETFATSVVGAFLEEHEVDVVPDIASAKARVTSGDYDAMLVDYDLDDGKGVELVDYVRASSNDVPIVAASAHARGNDELEAAGANGRCPKHRFHLIERVLLELVGRLS